MLFSIKYSRTLLYTSQGSRLNETSYQWVMSFPDPTHRRSSVLVDGWVMFFALSAIVVSPFDDISTASEFFFTIFHFVWCSFRRLL